MIRILNTDPVTGLGLMSCLIFAPEYQKTLFKIGYRDAQRNRGRLIDILDDY